MKIAENKMDGRAYFIPSSDLPHAMLAGNTENRIKSDRFMLLSGEWEFRYFDSCLDMDKERFSDYTFDKIGVPGCWQTTGYEKPYYINVSYPFPCTPPDVPTENPCGLYRKKFVLDRKFDRTFIDFCGVCSALELYVNGKYIGYSQGSHNTAEFDISDYVFAGENEIFAVVYKWSSGSYLEGQDFFRMNGIFRDVYLIFAEEAYLKDLTVRTPYLGDDVWSLEVDAEVVGGEAVFSLIDDDGTELPLIEENGKFRLRLTSPELWSAEQPNLYTLAAQIRRGGIVCEASVHKVGFRRVEIIDKTFLFNGEPVKLLGVNHHDTNPVTGWSMTFEDMRRDIELMKSYNINAMRTSHYPPDPRMIQLCDEMGIYVVDEADLESHGTYMTEQGYDYLSESEEWSDAFLDRVQRLYQRDKNSPCVVIFSLGNESGGIKNHDKCYEWLKSRDKDLLVHYEGAIRKERLGYDVVSMMYADYKTCIKHCDSKNAMPFMLCEYAHSMGVGPGGLEEYVTLIRNNRSFLGGFVWDFADQAIRNGDDYLYGGDFGEPLHDGNFCGNGLFLADRTPSISASEVKIAYQPFGAQLCADKSSVILDNRLYFANLVSRAVLTVLRDGEPYSSAEYDVDVPPRATAEYPLPEVPESGELFLNVECYTDGRLLGRTQLKIGGKYRRKIKTEERKIRRNGNVIRVTYGKGEFVFDTLHGALVGIKSDGEEILAKNPTVNKYNCFAKHGVRGFFPAIYRAPLDNDMYVKDKWKKLMYDKMWYNVRKVETAEIKDDFVITIYADFTPQKLQKLFECNIEYRFTRTKGLIVSAQLVPVCKGLADLPRFGLDIELKEEANRIEYYGLGDKQNYSDMSLSSVYGIYETDVDGLHEKYLKPQADGYRSKIRFARITKQSGRGIEVFATKDEIGFQASYYSDRELENKAHYSELKKSGSTILGVNGFMRGVGSQSCGPLLEKKYMIIPNGKLGFSFGIRIL